MFSKGIKPEKGHFLYPNLKTMKTTVPYSVIFRNLLLICFVISFGFSVNAQTYTTINNGTWNNASTWQGGNIPATGTIASSVVINIRHRVTYDGTNNISNYGTLNIGSNNGLTARLVIPTNILVENFLSGKVIITNAEYRQYRFAGGGESGTAQSGSFKNNGGYFEATNSYVEIAQDFNNENGGKRIFKNSSLLLGGNYLLSVLTADTLRTTSVSLGWHGNGDFTVNAGSVFFQSARIQLAGNSSSFRINSGIINGDIDYITTKNHFTNNINSGEIFISSIALTSGINLDAICATSSSKYMPNGKVSGTQTMNCSLSYFPATLFASTGSKTLDFSIAPVLVSGTDLQVGAVYKYESIAPGIDAYVKIDSFVNGATVSKIDDNAAGLGYLEGFQPEVKAGSSAGTSYVVFTMQYKVAGTSTSYELNTFDITALDIDGSSSLKEFDQIKVNTAAVANYMTSSTDISLTSPATNTFRGQNIAGTERSGIDTSAKANMFTVSASNVSSVEIKVGVTKTGTTTPSRQFGIYFKGFIYPNTSTLPVKLESFTATLSNDSKKVQLQWKTASELNVSHFIVERSLDGTNYTDAGMVFAYGSITDKADYVMNDNIAALRTGVIYYRLRSVDNDGKTQLSDIRIIRLSSDNVSTIKILAYPNPVRSDVRITVPATWQNKAAVYEVINLSGQVALRNSVSNSSQTETLNLVSLAPGVYFVRVMCNGQFSEQKIVKQ